MPVFDYKGINVFTGKPVTGIKDADNAKVLRTLLKREGILLTSAKEELLEKVGSSGSGGSMFGGVNLADVAVTTRQLATLVGAGIPLVEAVAALIEQSEKPQLKRVLTSVRDRLNEGWALARALEPHPRVFSNLYVSMVSAGEASGTLEAVLERLADYIESQSKLRGKVGAALAYPALMLMIGSVLIGVMMIVIVPKVTSIFASLDRALPWYTEVLIGMSQGLGSAQMAGFVLSITSFIFLRRRYSEQLGSAQATGRAATGLALGSLAATILASLACESPLKYAMGCVAGIIGGFAVTKFMAFAGTPDGQVWIDTKKLQLPIFGPLFRMLAVARFARTLSTLLKSGVPLLKAMDIVKNVLDNAKLERVVKDLSASVREGESIAGPLKKSGDFPPLVTHMIAVGEKSGQLEQMLETVAKNYDTQVDTRVQALTSLLEPLMIVVMGGSVGFIAFAILMPLIQMNDFGP